MNKLVPSRWTYLVGNYFGDTQLSYFQFVDVNMSMHNDYFRIVTYWI